MNVALFRLAQSFIRLLRPFAEQGDSDAQFMLGKIYAYGDALGERGVPQDSEEGIKWFLKAANQGDSRAQHFMENEQEDVRSEMNRKEYTAAIPLLLSLANNGVISAEYQLGEVYEDGLGVPQDYVQAHKWYNLASAQQQRPSEGAYVFLATTQRDQLAQKMTSEQIAQAQRLASEWKQK